MIIQIDELSSLHPPSAAWERVFAIPPFPGFIAHHHFGVPNPTPRNKNLHHCLRVITCYTWVHIWTTQPTTADSPCMGCDVCICWVRWQISPNRRLHSMDLWKVRRVRNAQNRDKGNATPSPNPQFANWLNYFHQFEGDSHQSTTLTHAFV